MGEWRPIEEAPRDGRAILVANTYTSAVVFWATEYADEPVTPGWYISDGKNEPIWYRGWPQLTHWQQPPALPGRMNTMYTDGPGRGSEAGHYPLPNPPTA